MRKRSNKEKNHNKKNKRDTCKEAENKGIPNKTNIGHEEKDTQEKEKKQEEGKRKTNTHTHKNKKTYDPKHKKNNRKKKNEERKKE